MDVFSPMIIAGAAAGCLVMGFAEDYVPGIGRAFGSMPGFMKIKATPRSDKAAQLPSKPPQQQQQQQQQQNRPAFGNNNNNNNNNNNQRPQGPNPQQNRPPLAFGGPPPPPFPAPSPQRNLQDVFGKNAGENAKPKANANADPFARRNSGFDRNAQAQKAEREREKEKASGDDDMDDIFSRLDPVK